MFQFFDHFCIFLAANVQTDSYNGTCKRKKLLKWLSICGIVLVCVYVFFQFMGCTCQRACPYISKAYGFWVAGDLKGH